jgi:hypothetical protein
MRRLLLDLQKLCEKFISQLNIEQKTVESKLYAVEELAIRGNRKMHNHCVKDIKEILKDNKIFDSASCHNHFRLETEEFYFGMIHNKIDKNSFVQSESQKLINGISYLISYFMLEAIKHNDVLLNYSRSYNVKVSDKFISQFLNLFDFERLEIFMKEHSLEGHNNVRVYINTLKAYLYFDNDFYYKEFKKSLYENLKYFSPSDIHFLFVRLTGYCILKSQASSENSEYYDREQFENYKFIIQNKYYETEANKYVPTDLFRNIIIQAAKLKELSWLEDFIIDYGNLLHPDKKTETIAYAYAILYFERNAYDEALGYLSRIKAEEFSYHLDIRNLYIKIYFEQEDYESALSSAKSFRKYLKENLLISDQKKAANLAFTGYIIKLINYYNTNSKTDLTSLEMQISRAKDAASKQWLLSKVTSISKSARRAI